MYLSTVFTMVGFTMSVCAIPITPSAPELQRRAEQFRLEGLKEHEIAEKLSLPATQSINDPSPFFSSVGTKIHSLFHDCDMQDSERDTSGDIAPGSLDVPQILPRPALSQPANALENLIALLWKDDAGNHFAYEGKELELRRPTGMRHWGAQDKWRLF